MADSTLRILICVTCQGRARLECLIAALSSSDANRFADIGDEDLSIADFARVGGFGNGVNRAINGVIPDNDLQLQLW